MKDQTESIDPPRFEVHPLLPNAAAFHQAGRLEEAQKLYLEILAQSPQDFDAMHLLGVIALQQGKYDAAQRLINAALAVNPLSAAAMGNLGTSYMRDGQLEPALHWFQIALQLEPDSALGLTNVATVLHNMGRYADALPFLRQVHAAGANSYATCNVLGACLLKNGEAREAVDVFVTATRLNPEDAEGWANLSVALNAVGRLPEARECAAKAVELEPQSSAAFGALAQAQLQQGKLADAIESYRQGVSAPGPSVQMLAAFASALLSNGLNEEAIEQLQRAIKLDENNPAPRWASVMALLKPIYKNEADLIACREAFSKALDEIKRWQRNSTGVANLHSAVGVIQPFYLAYQPYNNRELLSRYGALCTAWMATYSDGLATHPENLAQVPVGAARKIRLGIASAHINEHSVWTAITKGWVQNIDQTKFDLYLFQLTNRTDEETENAKARAKHLEDRPTDLAGWIQAIKARDLDILVYPEVGMDPLTLQLASLRLAPVQATTWGHPETTGLPTIDLYLSAEALEPADASANYSERLICLPNLGVYVEALTPRMVDPDLKALGLPSDEPLLLCPGSPFKYLPSCDKVWLQIAAQLRKRFMKKGSGGRLVFFHSRSEAMDRLLENRLRKVFLDAGVDFDARVSIIHSLDRPRFFGLMHRSALMLDTLGFSGFNTALQAVEAGLPVLAFEGEFMRGRLASGIMRQLELHDLVAASPEEFVQKAVALAADPERREELRREIVGRRDRLFNDLSPVRALEEHLTYAMSAQLPQ